MSDEEIADYCVQLIREEIARGFPNRTMSDFVESIYGRIYGPNKNPSPIFIPKRKKFKRRYKR